MTQRDVSIPTPDGTLDAGLHTPDGDGPWPAVIMYPDAGGVRPTFDEMASASPVSATRCSCRTSTTASARSSPFDMNTCLRRGRAQAG